MNPDEHHHDPTDGSSHGEDEHPTQMQGPPTDISGAPGPAGRDEALLVGGTDIGFTGDEIEILGEERSRNPQSIGKSLLNPLRLLGEVVHESESTEYDLGLVSPAFDGLPSTYLSAGFSKKSQESPEYDLGLVSPILEDLPSTHFSSGVSNKSHESPTIGSKEKPRLDNISRGTSIESGGGGHLGKSGSVEGSEAVDTRLTGMEPINPGHDGLDSESNRSALSVAARSIRDTVQSPGDEQSEDPSFKPGSDVSETSETTEERQAYYAIVNRLNRSHKEEIFQERQQALRSREDLFEYYEARYERYQKEARKKDRTEAHLRQVVNDMKRENEMFKAQHSEEEKRAQSSAEEILGLQGQLAKENGRVAEMETEIVCLRQRIAELEASRILEKPQEGLKIHATRIPAKRREGITPLQSKPADQVEASNDQDEAREANSSQQQSLENELQTSLATIKFQGRALFNTRLTISKMAREKEALIKDLAKKEGESKASRIRFSQLLKEAHEMRKKSGDLVEKLAAEVKELGLE